MSANVEPAGVSGCAHKEHSLLGDAHILPAEVTAEDRG